MKAIVDADAYTAAIASLPANLEKSYSWWLGNYPLNDQSRTVSKALAQQLKAYYDAQNQTKHFLGKNSIGSGADFVVESVLFFLKAYLAAKKKLLYIVSERKIGSVTHLDSRGKMRKKLVKPDISIYDINPYIYKDAKVIAAIECKTQLGRSRVSWEAEYEARKSEINQLFPKASVFFVYND